MTANILFQVIADPQKLQSRHNIPVVRFLNCGHVILAFWLVYYAIGLL